MNMVYVDYESSGSRINFDNVLEAAIICTDDRFKILEKIELKCRLKPNVVPSIGGMLVNNIPPETLKNAPLSHYQLVLENYKWFEKFRPAYFTGFNVTSFDIEFYRRMLFKTLIPDVYQTNTRGNKIHDVLPQVRAAKFINRNCIATKLNAKGNDSFKLQDLAEVGNFNHGTSHSSMVDCLNTIEVAQKVKQGAPEIWEASLNSAHRTDSEKIINSQKIFTAFEFFYGRLRPYLQKHLFYHNLYRWSICWDLKHHPKDYLNLDRGSLSKALQNAPKVIRTFKQNKNNVIMNKELGLKYEPYDKIGINEIMERSKILDQNPNFVNSISSILEDLAREKQESNQTELLFEETIYAGGFASPKDKDNMTKFHDVDLKGKLSLIEKFTQERYSYFAKCLLYEEYSKEQLPESLYNEMHRHFAKRLTSTNNEKFETFASFYKECDDHREKYKDDESKLKILEGYNNYVEKMEKKFENA